MKIYMISGKARHGKSTIGDFIKTYYESINKKVCMIQVGESLKDLVFHHFGWDGSEETKPRELLQTLGTDIIRVKLNKPLFHINRLIENIEILSEFFDVFVVTDVRFPLEFETVQERFPNTVKINVYRNDFDSDLTVKQASHITEKSLNDYDNYDYKIINTTLDKLKDDVDDICLKEVIKDEKINK